MPFPGDSPPPASWPPVQPPSHAGPPYDGGAVAAILLLGTCFLAPVSVVCGILGIRATRGGERRGRWCAVIGVVGGILLTTAVALTIGYRGELRELLTEDIDVTAGDCVDSLYLGDDFAGFDRMSCTDDHESEVAYRGPLDSTQLSTFDAADAAEICGPLLDGVYRAAARSGDYAVSVVTSNDEPAVGDALVCLLGSDDGAPLTAPIGKGT